MNRQKNKDDSKLGTSTMGKFSSRMKFLERCTVYEQQQQIQTSNNIRVLIPSTNCVPMKSCKSTANLCNLILFLLRNRSKSRRCFCSWSRSDGIGNHRCVRYNSIACRMIVESIWCWNGSKWFRLHIKRIIPRLRSEKGHFISSFWNGDRIIIKIVKRNSVNIGLYKWKQIETQHLSELNKIICRIVVDGCYRLTLNIKTRGIQFSLQQLLRHKVLI